MYLVVPELTGFLLGYSSFLLKSFDYVMFFKLQIRISQAQAAHL